MGIRKIAPTKQTQNITAMQTPIQVAKQDKTTPCCPIYIEGYRQKSQNSTVRQACYFGEVLIVWHSVSVSFVVWDETKTHGNSRMPNRQVPSS
jgi:hypothetical protein